MTAELAFTWPPSARAVRARRRGGRPSHAVLAADAERSSGSDRAGDVAVEGHRDTEAQLGDGLLLLRILGNMWLGGGADAPGGAAGWVEDWSRGGADSKLVE